MFRRDFLILMIKAHVLPLIENGYRGSKMDVFSRDFWILTKRAHVLPLIENSYHTVRMCLVESFGF